MRGRGAVNTKGQVTRFCVTENSAHDCSVDRDYIDD